VGSWIGAFGHVADASLTHAIAVFGPLTTVRGAVLALFVTHAFHALESAVPTISLDQIKADIEAKYAPVVIDLGDASVTLTQVLRLSKAKRAALVAAEKERDTDGDGFDEEGTVEYLRTVLRLVATDRDEAEYLIEALGDDLVLLTEVVTAWREGTQAGEASPSAS
jgi:hypothetical protein